ncbi:RNA polymerase sigma factor [Nocardia amamiensis]|uniref:RNA polymerase sigma factor n=1 Tax=Nocardia amamiensis TaxID=404578 RepID=UPI00083068D6|nr:sigma-70 family RNA polymerase sigma factor [Nocardia amamiensis]
MTNDRLTKPNRERFEALYRLHRGSVRRHLLIALCGDGARADDFEHEVFLRVFKTYGPALERKTEDQQRALLIKVAKNCVVEMWRKDSKLVFRDTYIESDVPLGKLSASDSEEFDQVLDRDLVQRFIAVASRKLTVGEFRVAFLGWFMDESDAAIAKALGTSVKTVRAHRCSARTKIRTFANRDGHEITFADAEAAEQKKTTPGVGEVTV